MRIKNLDLIMQNGSHIRTHTFQIIYNFKDKRKNTVALAVELSIVDSPFYEYANMKGAYQQHNYLCLDSKKTCTSRFYIMNLKTLVCLW